MPSRQGAWVIRPRRGSLRADARVCSLESIALEEAE